MRFKVEKSHLNSSLPQVYHSYTMDPAAGNLPVISGDNYHPIRSRIASSTRDMVIFEDGTRLSTPNRVQTNVLPHVARSHP